MLRATTIGLALALLACTTHRDREPTGDTEKVETPQPEPEPITASEPPPDERRWACARDEDCTQTCALGAVSADWLEDNPNADDCDDGCYWRHDDVRCRDGGCVTINEDGSVHEGCTRRTRGLGSAQAPQ